MDVSAVKIGKTGYGFAIDKTGLAIAHPKKEYNLEIDLLQQDGTQKIISRMIAGETASQEYSFKRTRKAGDQMNLMVAAIQEVTRASEETGKIIKTIDQTKGRQ